MLRGTKSSVFETFIRVRWKALRTRNSCDLECAGYFRGTWPTAADFEFLLGATGAGIVASGFSGLRSGHGGGISACFDSLVRDAD